MGESAIDILYVITDLKLGGVPLHLRRLALAMRERGHHVRVVSLGEKGPVARMLTADGVDVLGCDGRGGGDFRVIGNLARIIQQHEPDVIHALLFHANVAARWAVQRAEFPHERLLCEIQTVEVERKWHLLVDRFTHQDCRFTIGNSPSVVEHLAARARIPRDRLRLVRGGIDTERVEQVAPLDRTTLDLDTEGPLVLWVGRLDPVKGLDQLIDAFGAIAEGTSASLLLAGTGPLRNRLASRIARRHLRDRIHLLGARNDVWALMKAADLFVFPSRTEGLPNALLEAMAAGCAILATDVPGCRDLIEHERTGLLVPYGDTTTLAAAMHRLLTDRPHATRLGRCAAETARRDWHIAQTFVAYEALYREVSQPV